VPDAKAQPQGSSPPMAVPRPLRTGGQFTIVLPKRRVLYRHWSKEVYLPGEEADLIVETDGTDGETYELTVEKAPSEDGPWEQVTSLEAKADGGRARAKYKFPKPEPKGRLTKAEWKRRRAEPGDRLGLHVEAQGCEGAFLSIHVEKQQQDGSWDVYTRWQGKIENGKYDGVFAVPPRDRKAEEAAARLDAKKGRIVEVSFERAPVDGGRAWMQARIDNLDKTQVRFVLERADEHGNWVEIGSAVSTVRKGAARNSVPVPPLPAAAAANEPPGLVRWTIVRLQKSDEVLLAIDPQWLKGRAYTVALERRLLDEAGWQRLSAVQPRTPTPATQVKPAGPSPSAPERPVAPPVAIAPPPVATAPTQTPPPVVTRPPPPSPIASSPAPAPPPQPHPAVAVQPVARPPSAAPVSPAAHTPIAPAATPVTRPPVQATPVPAHVAPAPVQPTAAPVPAAPTPVQAIPIPVSAIPIPVQAIPTPIPVTPTPVQVVPPPTAAIPTPMQPVAPLTLTPAAPPQVAPPPPMPSAPASAAPTPPTAAPPANVAVPPPQPPDLASAPSATFSPPETPAGAGSFPGAPSTDAPALPSLADAPSAPGNESLTDTLAKARKAKERAEDTADKLAEAREKADGSASDETNIEE
jgi:hypothetical protein